MQGDLNPLLVSSQPQRNTNNSKIHQLKLSERPLPFLPVLSGALKHHGLKCACSFAGTAQPQSKDPAGGHQQTRETNDKFKERNLEQGPHNTHILPITLQRRPADGGHQQEPCPDSLSNSLLIWIASALWIQLNHASDFCCP